jgi:hypothetical protein
MKPTERLVQRNNYSKTTEKNEVLKTCIFSVSNQKSYRQMIGLEENSCDSLNWPLTLLLPDGFYLELSYL